MRSWSYPFFAFVIVTGGLEFFSAQGWIASYIFPAPSMVFKTLIHEADMLAKFFFETLLSSGMALFLSGFLGITAAIGFSAFRVLRKSIYPYTVFFQTVPIIAIAPLLVIWFGFGQKTVVISAFIVSVFPVLANTLDGLDSADPMLRDLFRMLKANRRTLYSKLLIPSAIPQIISGLRVAAGLAVIGAVVGEFIAGGGLGSVVDSGRAQQRLDLVFAAVLLISFIGLLFIISLNLLSRFLLKSWHHSQR